MTRRDPGQAIAGTQVGRICDRCNRGIRTGDLVRCYATYYEDEGWLLRRLWCEDCGGSTIERTTEGADEAIIEAVFWHHRLVSTRTIDRNRPETG